MATAAETTFYEKGLVKITNARVVLENRAYALANISSVTLGEKPANRKVGIIVAVIGLIIAACSGAAGDQGTFGIVFGVLMLGAGIVVAAIAKPMYTVRIGSAGGEVDGLLSKDRGSIQEIVSAVNEAIIRRG